MRNFFQQQLWSIAIFIALGAITTRAQQWQYIAPMLKARIRPNCALLPDGRILVIGGELTPSGSGVLSECEIYNPSTNTWSTTGSMHVPRFWDAVATLQDGRIFVAGGYTSVGQNFNATATNTCEIYDPVSGAWQMTDTMVPNRACFDAFTLSNGNVLLLGGLDSTTSDFTNIAEEFDPKTQKFVPAAQPAISTCGYQMVYSHALNGIFTAGSVFRVPFEPRDAATVELYDFGTNSWKQLAPLPEPVSGLQQLVELNDGKLAMLSGRSGFFATTKDAQVYNPATNSWTIGGPLPYGHDYGSAYILNGDTAIVIGGFYTYATNGTVVPTSCIDFTSGVTWAGPVPNTPRTSQASIMVSAPAPGSCSTSKTIYIFAGGDNSDGMLASCEKLVIPGSALPSLAMEHRSSGASFFNQPDTLPLLLDVDSKFNLDSLWPSISDISGTYLWDSVVDYLSYLPPQGWSTTALSAKGDSVSFTIHKLSAAATNPLSLGTAIFYPSANELATTWVSLEGLTLVSGDETIPLCVSQNEDSHWSVKVLGSSGVAKTDGFHEGLIASGGITDGMLILRYRESERTAPINLTIFDVLGRQVFSSAISVVSTVAEINLTSLEPGVYYLRVDSGASSEVQKIVIPGA